MATFLNNQVWYCGSTKWTAVAAWAATTSYPAGSLVRQLATPTNGNERVFLQLATTSPISGAAEPTWTVTQGAKTTDATCTWIEVTGKPAVNGDATNTYTWANMNAQTQSPSQGVIIKNNAATFLFVASTVSGNIGGAQPTFNTTTGSTTTDGSVTWTCIGSVSAFSAYAAPWARISLAMSSVFFILPNDTVYVSNNHAETQAAIMNNNNSVLTGNSLSQVLSIVCVSDTVAPPTTLATTATVTTTGASNMFVSMWSNSSLAGVAYVYGITFSCGTGASAATLCLGSYNGATKFENCNFTLGTTSGSSTLLLSRLDFNTGTQCSYKNCNFLFGATGQTVNIDSAPIVEGGTWAATGSIPTTLFIGGHNNPGNPIFRDVDFSTINTTLFNINGLVNMQPVLQNCKLAAGVTVTTGSFYSPIAQSYRLHNSDSSNTNYRYYLNSTTGSIQQETTVVRTGGATNGTTGISLNMTSSANSSYYFPLASEDISVWNTNASGAQTATIFLTSNTALTNGLFWAEVEYLGTSSFPLGLVVTSRAVLLASTSALTTDSSTWGGSISNKYKIVLNFTPTQVGVLKIRLYCASPSTTVYVDPEPVISNQTSGRQYIIPGGTFHNDASSSGGSSSMVVHPGLTGGMHG